MKNLFSQIKSLIVALLVVMFLAVTASACNGTKKEKNTEETEVEISSDNDEKAEGKEHHEGEHSSDEDGEEHPEGEHPEGDDEHPSDSTSSDNATEDTEDS